MNYKKEYKQMKRSDKSRVIKLSGYHRQNVRRYIIDNYPGEELTKSVENAIKHVVFENTKLSESNEVICVLFEDNEMKASTLNRGIISVDYVDFFSFFVSQQLGVHDESRVYSLVASEKEQVLINYEKYPEYMDCIIREYLKAKEDEKNNN